MTVVPRLRTVLFDLDGTLLDTAPDLIWAVNALRAEQGLAALPHDVIRPTVSHGTPSMLQVALDVGPDHPNFPVLRKQLLDIYQTHLVQETTLFHGMAEVLTILEEIGMNWGVVTNKPAFLTDPIMTQLGLMERAATVVSGDTTPFAKPHPAPLLHACAVAGSLPQECVFVGDAERDIAAGRAAGMATLVALFGYLAEDDRPHEWGADAMVESPATMLAWIRAQ
ncbi:N-acetylmuramic acid 6-phosphate phosphatase [Gammaproteobacteria bacterium]